MLQFNPFFRPTVDELLSDNYFSDVRQFSQAYDSPSEIVFDFENTQMSIQKTRELFIDEIQYYKALRCSGLSEVSPARIKMETSVFSSTLRTQLRQKLKRLHQTPPIICLRILLLLNQ